MSDPRTTLKKQFEPPNRWPNFGDILVQIRVTGLRCHRDTIVDISSPITAFCGINGTGKSTLLQIAAISYKNTNGLLRHYISNFIIAGKLDQKPFADDATIRFEYWQEPGPGGAPDPKIVTISRGNAKWTGYKRQPHRRVYFAGVGLYLPRIEEWRYAARHASKMTIQSMTPLSQDVKSRISEILGTGYDSADENKVMIRSKSEKVVAVARDDAVYSEINMGCGEGRVHHIISVLEELPEHSLVLLEEPETSLHPSAQYNFGRYLVDACLRKHHQIFLTTHSDALLDALPSESRLFLTRAKDGIRVIPGPTAAQARSLMSEGYHKALNVLVEDRSAKAVLSEMIRRIDRDFLSSIGIYPVGNDDSVKRTVKALRETPLSVAGVLDGDKAADPASNIFKLPGSEAPEKQMFDSKPVKERIEATYGLAWDDFRAGLGSADHHGWCRALAGRVAQEEAAILSELARAYAASVSENEAAGLLQQLKAAAEKKAAGQK